MDYVAGPRAVGSVAAGHGAARAARHLRRDEPRHRGAAPRRLFRPSASATTASRATISRARSTAGRRQYRASETEKIEAMDRLIEWLPVNIPPGDATTIVHGDYRLDNMIFHPTEPRVLAVLDWELSTLGHPMADFSLPHDDLAAVARAVPRPSRQRSRVARHSDRGRISRDVFAAHRRRGQSGSQSMELLHGLQHVPHGRHTPGRHGARAGRQRGERAGVGSGQAARPMAESGWAEVERMLA